MSLHQYSKTTKNRMKDQIAQLIKRSANAWSKYGLISVGTTLAQSSILNFLAYITMQPNTKTLFFRGLFLNTYSGNEKQAEDLLNFTNSMMAENHLKYSALMAVGTIAALMSWKRHGIDFKLRRNDPLHLRPLLIIPTTFLLAWAAKVHTDSAICLSLKHNQELLNYISQATGLVCYSHPKAGVWMYILLIAIFFLGTRRTIGRWLNKVGLY